MHSQLDLTVHQKLDVLKGRYTFSNCQRPVFSTFCIRFTKKNHADLECCGMLSVHDQLKIKVIGAMEETNGSIQARLISPGPNFIELLSTQTCLA